MRTQIPNSLYFVGVFFSSFMSSPAEYLELYAILLTLVVMVVVLSEWIAAHAGNRLWTYIKVFLLLCVPVLVLYGFFRPLSPDLSLVLKIQAIVLTLIVFTVLTAEFLASMGLNRFVAYLLLLVFDVVVVAKTLPLL